MKSKIVTLALIIAAGLAQVAQAATFTLDQATATLISGSNTVSSFYQVNSPDNNHVAFYETGSATGLYGFTTGGNSLTGWWVDIAFGDNAQPVLQSAFIKAGNNYLWWDSADLSVFNSGSFSSIRLIQNGIWNKPHNALLGTSHAGVNGRPGNNVPDGGATSMLLGSGLLGLAIAARRMRSVNKS